MNITWKISNIEWIESVGDFTKVVKNVHYWVQAEDDAGNMGYTWGNVQLDIDNLTTFTDFDALTEETVIGWAKTALNSTYFSGPLTGAAMMEQEAKRICLEQDPLRKRGIGMPWQL